MKLNLTKGRLIQRSFFVSRAISVTFSEQRSTPVMSGEPTGGAFHVLLHSQLVELKKKCGSIFHRTVRDSVSSTESYLQSEKEAISLSRALAPFFIAMNEDYKTFELLVFDCFYKVFQRAQSRRDVYPNRKLTERIVQVLLKPDKTNSDNVNLLCCNVCIACLQSPSGIYFCHGRLLRQMVRLNFWIYNVCENTLTQNSIRTSTYEVIAGLLSSYRQPPDLPHGLDLANYVTENLLHNTVSIHRLLGDVLADGDFTPSIRDADMFAVLGFLARVIEKVTMKLRTIVLAVDCLIWALRQTCHFFDTHCFIVLLRKRIHLAFLTLSLDPNQRLVQPIVDLLLLVWQKFSVVYNEGLNNVLVKGIATTLTSPQPAVLESSLQIYKLLSLHIQFFVDAYVNYDCDESGYFGNVFENTVNLIVKLAYPDSPVQRLALETIVSLVQSLWKYFTNPEYRDDRNAEPAEAFLEAKKTKNIFSQGIELFKRGFKKGIHFFVEHDFVKDDPPSLAKFLFNTPNLDPGEVGQLLGSPGYIEVLKEFVNLFDFQGIGFEQAFRQFLQKFQIPGEAQMIDRVMERFGTKYYCDNPNGVFTCADTVYVLSFATLMLHTDAHHPLVKSRMTLEQFIENNKGQYGENDLPREFLTELYQRITAKAIFHTGSIGATQDSLLTREQRSALYRTKCRQMLTEAQQQRTRENRVFHCSESPSFVGPMFQAVWRGILAVLTMSFERSDDNSICEVCISGLTLLVHIASHCFIEEALDTLVDSFGTLTRLRKGVGVLEAKPKNFKCTNALIEIALEDRNYLRGAWDIVMGELSAIDRIAQSQDVAQRAILEHFDLDAVSTLFIESTRLDRESIVDFIGAICCSSMKELYEAVPRTYLLEQLRIIAETNMNRPRYIWLSVWDLIGGHLKAVAEREPRNAINILYALASKFLQQTELSHFHFQSRFMKPFQQIYENTTDFATHEYILLTIKQLLRSVAAAMQSGWDVVFHILAIAAEDRATENLAFGIITMCIRDRMKEIQPKLGNCLIVLSTIVQKAVDDLREAAVSYYVRIASHLPQSDVDTWAILFQVLARAAQNQLDSVRRIAHAAMCQITVDSDVLSDEIIEKALIGSIPQFFAASFTTPKEFFVAASEFELVLFPRLIEPRWSHFGRFFKEICAVLVANILAPDAEFVKTSLDTFFALVTPRYRKFEDDKLEALFGVLMAVAAKLAMFSVPNGRLFLAQFFILQKQSQNESRFLQVLDAADRACSDAGFLVLWAETRMTMIQILLTFDLTEKIAGCLQTTISVFLATNFQTGQDEAAWNDAVILQLKLLNDMPKKLFDVCFETACDGLLELVAARSAALRAQLNVAMQRRLM
jgi:hypothetical protein